jgi:uncharacterized protein (DUF4213/DUF364 family)
MDSQNTVALNAFDLLARLGAGKKVVLVGHFPQVEWLQARVGSLIVLEKRMRPGDYPAEAAPELIPQADVVAITGMTILNHTLDGLLELCPPTARVIILGPSAPLTQILFNFGVDYICGTVITDEEEVLLTVMQGGSANRAHGTKKITLCKDPEALRAVETKLPEGRI